MSERTLTPVSYESVNRAFTKQSHHFDADDEVNLLLQAMRKQVYTHIEQYLKPNSHILELNAGTGIDALYFVSKGHRVHATDLALGMVETIRRKRNNFHLEDVLSVQQLSYTQLNQVKEKNYDFVFSNFGGLNCVKDLSDVTKDLAALLKPGAYISWVIMPSVCLWEILSLFNGNFKAAFRRFKPGGVMAHLEGEYFKTHYHNLNTIKKSFPPSFKFVKSEGLAALIPQPHRSEFPMKYPRMYKWLLSIDQKAKDYFPFNRCADHIIVTFQYLP